MAATETRLHDTIMLTAIDADWTASDYYNVYSITFIPGAANDVMVVKEATDAGVIIFYALSADADHRTIYYNGARFKPMVDFSDCTLNAGHEVIINLMPRPR